MATMDKSWIMYMACAACLSILSASALKAQETQADSLTTAESGTSVKHWEFTLEDVIVAAQSKSLPAMIAKYSFISSYWESISMPDWDSTTARSYPCRTRRPARHTTCRTTI